MLSREDFYMIKQMRQQGCSGSQKARMRSKKDATPCYVAF